MRKKNETLELCQKIMVDPIVDIEQNFSLEKSKFHYEKWAKQREMGDRHSNPADKHEEVVMDFSGLDDLAVKSIEAHNLVVNLRKEEFLKGVDWYLRGHSIVISWHRLKTFDEWLHDGLKDAITQHYKTPEASIEKILREKFNGGFYSNTDIHLWLEGKIDDEVLKRLGKYEKCQSIEDRDLEKDIDDATKTLLESKTTVLTLKV